MKRIAAPMVGGVMTSAISVLVAYPAIVVFLTDVYTVGVADVIDAISRIAVRRALKECGARLGLPAQQTFHQCVRLAGGGRDEAGNRNAARLCHHQLRHERIALLPGFRFEPNRINRTGRPVRAVSMPAEWWKRAWRFTRRLEIFPNCGKLAGT
jgi:hypothetical protein